MQQVDRLNYFLKKSKLSVAQVFRAVIREGVDPAPSTVKNWFSENGTEVQSEDNFKALARVFRVPVCALLGEPCDPESDSPQASD